MQLHLHTYGTYLHVKDAMFDIRKKQADGSWSSTGVAVHKIKSVWVSRGIAISSDAVSLALKNHVDIVFLEGDGAPIGRVWHSRPGSTTRIRKRQLEASLGAEGLARVKDWLCQKLENQLDFVRDLKKHRPQHLDFLNEKVERISAMRLQIAAAEAPVLTEKLAESLRGWEGTAGRMYFETLSFVLPKLHQFEGRSSRPAHDPFNAMLNYGYGMLYSKVEKALMLAGLDPYIGFLHRDDYNHRSLVYDFIEPYRAWVDKVVFTLFSGKKGQPDALRADDGRGFVVKRRKGPARGVAQPISRRREHPPSGAQPDAVDHPFARCPPAGPGTFEGRTDGRQRGCRRARNRGRLIAGHACLTADRDLGLAAPQLKNPSRSLGTKLKTG